MKYEELMDFSCDGSGDPEKSQLSQQRSRQTYHRSYMTSDGEEKAAKNID
jgi:hypothetical protein